MNDAIQPDVSKEVEENEQAGSAALNRIKVVNEIAQMANERREQEVNGDSTSGPDPVVQEADDAQPDITNEEQVVIDEPVIEPKKTEKLKIDGVEQEIDHEKIMDYGRRALQKDLSADKRLEEATRTLNEARALAAQLSQRDVAPKAPEFDVAKIAAALQYGGEEEARAAVEQLTNLGRTATPIESIAPAVNDAVDFRLAAEKFQSDFKDIVSDPMLRDIVIRKEAEARQNGDKRSYSELYSALGEEVRAWWRGSPKNSGSDELAQKRAKKETMPTTVKTASVVQTKEAPRPPTHEEILNKMRKARHQL